MEYFWVVVPDVFQMAQVNCSVKNLPMLKQWLYNLQHKQCIITICPVIPQMDRECHYVTMQECHACMHHVQFIWNWKYVYKIILTCSHQQRVREDFLLYSLLDIKSRTATQMFEILDRVYTFFSAEHSKSCGSATPGKVAAVAKQQKAYSWKL